MIVIIGAQSWLLYSIPVMSAIVAPPYMTHISLLVAAVHIIGGDNISQEHLQLATDFMDGFYQQMEDLYGEQMHISLHVVT